jgi:hypothetical protein
MNSPEDNLISIQTSKEVTRLYKSLLELLEDVKNDHEIMLKKIADAHGQDFANQVNYFTQDKYEQLRKRILDNGNECGRQLLSFLEYFDFTINKEKVEEAAKQRRVVKKFVTNSRVTIE